VGAISTIELQGRIGVGNGGDSAAGFKLTRAGMNEIGTDHYASSTFASFAVNGSDVRLFGIEPGMEVVTEWLENHERRRIVIWKGIARFNRTAEFVDIIASRLLGAEIIDFIVTEVLVVEKLDYIMNGITVERFNLLLRGEAHRDEIPGNV